MYFSLLYCTVRYYNILYSNILYFTVLLYTVLYSTVLYCTLLYCTLLHCTLLYATALYCTALTCDPILHKGQLSTHTHTHIQYIPLLCLACTFHAFSYLYGRSSYKQSVCYTKHRQFHCSQHYCNVFRLTYYETVR